MKKLISVNIEEAVIEAGKAAAREDGRSFSNWLERLILEATRTDGGR